MLQLQGLRALEKHIGNFEDKSDSLGEVYYGYQSESKIKTILDRYPFGCPCLIGCYKRLPLSKEDIRNARRPYGAFVDQVSEMKRCWDNKDGCAVEYYWNNFEVLFDSDDPKKKCIHLFNIQLGNRDVWEKLINNVFAPKSCIKNRFFVFYWLPPLFSNGLEAHIQNKNEFEVRDKLWSYSRFLRDYLIAQSRAIEVPLERDGLPVELHRLEMFLSCKDNDECMPNKHFISVTKRIKKSLKIIYGSNFPTRYGIRQIMQTYLHNKSNHAVADREEWEKLENEVVGSTKTLAADAHGILGAVDKCLRNYDPQKKEKFMEESGGHFFWNHFLKTISSLTTLYLSWPTEAAPSFLCIDDHPDKIAHLLRALQMWFPYGSAGYLESNKWPDLLKENINILDSLKQSTVRLYGPEKAPIDVDFWLIDLEFEGQNKGFEILRKIRTATRNRIKPFVVTLSRRDDPESIQRSLNSGALFHITKSHFFEIVPAVCQVWKHIKKIREQEKKRYAQYENWHLLSKLPLRIILELQSQWIFGKEYRIEHGAKRWGDDLESSADYQWIKKLPKADLHCHIGSCMSPNVLAQTALLVLAEKAAQDGNQLKEVLPDIVNFLLPIASDPNLNELKKSETKENSETKNYKNSFGFRDIKAKSILEIVAHAYSLRERNILPERALLDPHNTLLEETCLQFARYESSKYFQRKVMLRQLSVSYDLVMLVFVLLLHVRDHFSEAARGTAIIETIERIIKILQPGLKETGYEKYDEAVGGALYNFDKLWGQLSKRILNAFTGLPPTKNILKFLQSAHSDKRCLEPGCASLFNYLRGCEYGGSQNLQTKASIFLTVDSVVKYALSDKIRYLCLRCAVNGYTKFGLQSGKEATESLLHAIDYYAGKSCDDGNKVHINVILAANRQRDAEDFGKNADLALKYQHGLPMRKDHDDNEAEKYYSSGSRVVSFDLFGLEKGNRPSKFKEQFRKLQEESFPATIHAGEEDGAESIREAVYDAFTQRIGHGLSLRQDIGLLRMVRERHITIELCPLSNLLTSGKYKLREEIERQYKQELERIRDEDKPTQKDRITELEQEYLISRDEYYPLRQYLNANLDVTINSDNPRVSEATLSKEFLVAARLVGGLTKWEILRLIKNSFRGAAIPKDEKRKLMNEIDDEIYELMLHMSSESS